MFGDSVFDDEPGLSVQAAVLLALFVSRSDRSDDLDWVQSAVLSQSVWNDFEGSCEVLDYDSVDSTDLLAVNFELLSDFDFRRATSWNDRPVLDQASDDAECVMERPLGFVKNEHVGSSDQYAESLRVCLAAGDLEDLGSVTETDILDLVRLSELLDSELVDVGDWDTADSLE